jgi:hypothetical protein
VASGGETTISGADANGAVLAYTAGLEQVVLNGAVLVRGHDYTATNGTSITGLSPALVASDVLEVFSFIAFTVANTYTQSQVDGLIAASPGLKLLTPSSVSVGSGSSSISSTGTVTFSGASSVTVNGVFSSAYDNYKIIISNGSGSTGCKLKLGSTSTGYYYWASYGRYNATTVNGENGANVAAWVNMATASSTHIHGDITLYSPYLAKSTTFENVLVTVGTGEYHWRGGGYLNDTSSYTAFTLTADTGTINGNIQVYGYKV